jgi:hypothetical protein
MDLVSPGARLVRIPDTFDTIIQKQYLREYADSRFPLVRLSRLDRVRTYKDPLYNEAMARRFLDPVDLRAYAEHSPPKKTLIKYGLDQDRPVMFKATTLHLADLGILENRDDFLIGDLVLWGGDTYEIKDQTRDTEAYWANTNIPFFVVLGADYYREGS